MIVRTDDFQREQRWPHYSAEVLKLGLRSALSFKLYTSRSNAGALNIFGVEPEAFGPDDEAVGPVLAAHAAAAILASRQGEQLQSALSSRDLIGQAKGVIMERYNVTWCAASECAGAELCKPRTSKTRRHRETRDRHPWCVNSEYDGAQLAGRQAPSGVFPHQVGPGRRRRDMRNRADR